MTKKEYRAIYNCISNAQSAIEELACENYPYTEFLDKDLKEMFYELNRMCIALHSKMED